MRPWPPELQAMFPPAPDRLPERPWWCRANGGWHFWRTDHQRTEPPRVVRDVVTFDAHAVLTAHAAEAARLDRSNPLPFPGVRVGQVWVHPLWASYNKDFGPYIANTVSFVRPKDARAEFGPFTTPLDFADLEREGFLIADPCCPHLAPWSPPEAP